MDEAKLKEIEDRFNRSHPGPYAGGQQPLFTIQHCEDARALIAEVRRLRAELGDYIGYVARTVISPRP